MGITFAKNKSYASILFQQIAEQKLKAFSIGTMGKRPLSKREIEEQRKKEEEEAAAHVSFSDQTVHLRDAV